MCTTSQGVPYLRQLVTWHCCEPKERTLHAMLTALVKLLACDPSPEPATHLNPEAASLRFSCAAPVVMVGLSENLSTFPVSSQSLQVSLTPSHAMVRRQSDEQKKDYKKQVKKRVQRSMEM